jgi:hypothetical protein
VPWQCSVCPRSDRKTIDTALEGGTSFRKVAQTFGLGRTSVTNHAGRCIGVVESRERSRAAQGRQRRKTPAVAVDVAAVESPADVMREVQRMYKEAWALYEEAKRTRDTRLMDKALGQIGSTIDRFAKAMKVYDDGTHFVNDHSTKVLQIVSKMSEDELRAYLAGGIGRTEVIDA